MNSLLQRSTKDAKSLGLRVLIMLSFQHTFAMFGATVLVPILVKGQYEAATGTVLSVGVTVSTALFFAGAGSLLFHFLTQGKVPAFLGSSFAFLGGYATVANLDTGKFAGMSANDKIAYACGGIVVAGLLYLVLALIIWKVGVKRVMRFLPPIVTGPMIICIGLSLAASAVSNASTNWPIALVAIITVIAFNVWGKGYSKIIPILLGIIVSYLFALVLHFLDFTNADGSSIMNFQPIADASIVGLPTFIMAKFDLNAILVMAPIMLATIMEHVGDMSAISATVGQNFIKDPGLARSLAGDGLATALSAMFGGPANTTYGENTGVLELSQVHKPVVVQGAAIIAIILSFFPKVTALISTMPTAVIGGISFILYGMIAIVGGRNLVENHVNLKSSRNLIVGAIILVCGLGLGSGITFTIGGTTITLTALAVAALAGIILNAILPGKDYEFDDSPGGVADGSITITDRDRKASK